MNVLTESVAPTKKHNVFLASPPKNLKTEFDTLFTLEAIEFLVDLIEEFDDQVDQLYYARFIKKYKLKRNPKIPAFLDTDIVNSDWKVAPVGRRLQNRHLDLGDVSPSNLDHFTKALGCNVEGIQVDFDDGHCPTWRNQILGFYNVYKAVRNELPNVPPIWKAPILMLRPRAWNMLEHNVTVNGKEVPGPLLDFVLLTFHNANILRYCESGPYFYLSKLEGASEAKLWNDIFTWTESRFGMPCGTIKACVLIENILSSFEMDQILFNLKDHSLGLNCGIWDYAASIINKFGNNKSFILPDRNKYVNMNRHFLKCYMELVVKTCHRRGAHATGGMAALLLPTEDNSDEFHRVVETVVNGKLAEIQMGVDGFMVFDVGLVPYMNNLWKKYGGPSYNQIKYPGTPNDVSEADLLKLPTGGVTIDGLKHNISVTILFIFYWLQGVGHFAYKGAVEDSATAEISRSQIWQWIRHGAKFEDGNGDLLTRGLVDSYACKIIDHLLEEYCSTFQDKINLHTARDLFTEIVNHREFPDFITTYLNDAHVFRRLHHSSL
ncbi:malate synthase-like [Diprion similis]|uniref:malate synthase-like n=1 Tax=Diprion similis TaxID=362088 RepID=UPI001EF824FB|nr:malate synthase-like [Diprion similis]